MALINADNSPAIGKQKEDAAFDLFSTNSLPGWVGAAQIGADLWGMSQQKKQASATRKFQRQMSNTAHVRQVRDLRLAGLNPVLAAGGSGASTPSGAQAQLPQVRNPMAAGIQAAQGAASAKLTAQNAKVASLEAKHKEAFYKMVQDGPGGAEIAAFNAMFPGNKAGQGAAALNLGVGKAMKNKEWFVNTGKQSKKWWDKLKDYMYDVQYPDKSGKRYGKASRAENLKGMAKMRRPSFEKNEPWADAMLAIQRRKNRKVRVPFDLFR